MPILMNMYGSNGVSNGPESEYDSMIVNCNTDANGNATGIPKTPEILNLLASISPLEECLKGNSRVEKISPVDSFSADTCSSNSTVDSPTSPPNHRSSDIKLQFIKTNLKLTIQKKRKNQNLTTSHESDMNPSSLDSCTKCDESSMDTEEDDGNSSHSEANSLKFGLTPEDEERRKRRRERNKIAATKCRLKKRVRQDLLLKESSALENQNQELKLKIEDLREEYQRLKNMYADHKGSCVKPSPETSPVEELIQPPSFSANDNGGTVSNPVFIAANYETTNSLQSDLMHHHQNNMYDYNGDPFVRNPSVMLSESEDACKSTYLRPNGPSADASYKLMPPMSSFNLIMEDSGNHHFDMTYVQ